MWLNNRGDLLAERKGRVHVEHIAGEFCVNNAGELTYNEDSSLNYVPVILIFCPFLKLIHLPGGLSLVFERIVLQDRGNWSCAWVDNKDIRSTFKMIIKREKLIKINYIMYSLLLVLLSPLLIRRTSEKQGM